MSAISVKAPIFIPRPKGTDSHLIGSREDSSRLDDTSVLVQQNVANQFFASDLLRDQLQRKFEAQFRGVSTGGHPRAVHVYTDLAVLEAPGNIHRGSLDYRVWEYRATSTVDGRFYSLLRVEGLASQQAAIAAAEKWTHLRHPGIVALHEVFTSRAFGDQSTLFAYDFHPCTRGFLSNCYASARSAPERQLCSHIVQVTLALKSVHSSGLALRVLSCDNIVLTESGRLRISLGGLQDVLTHDGASNITLYQQEDLMALGRLILWMMDLNHQHPHEHASSSLMGEIQKAAMYLLSTRNPNKSLDFFLMNHCTPWMEAEITKTYNNVDMLEDSLASELQNGRLVRLFIKMGFVNERSGFQQDPKWSETGDRYIVKLFRDYVFHQVDMQNNPILDLSHVLLCMNKLDAGSEERIMMISEDEQSCLIVSYREVKKCIVNCFDELALHY